MKTIDKMSSAEWQEYREDKLIAYLNAGNELNPDPDCVSCDPDNDYVCFQCEICQIDYERTTK